MRGVRALLVVAALLSWGCELTDYPVITDTFGDEAGVVVNTNGQVFVENYYDPVITIYPDYNVEGIFYLDQATNGDQLIYNYASLGYGEPTFIENTYCSPDWTRCWVSRAWNPVEGDEDPFDHVHNDNCSGSEALSDMISIPRTRECGRSLYDDVSVQTLAIILAELPRVTEHGMDGYTVRLDRSSLRADVRTDDGGHYIVRPSAPTDLFLAEEGGIIVTLGPSQRGLMLRMADIQERHPGGLWVSFDYRGLTWTQRMKLETGKVRSRAQSL